MSLGRVQQGGHLPMRIQMRVLLALVPRGTFLSLTAVCIVRYQLMKGRQGELGALVLVLWFLRCTSATLFLGPGYITTIPERYI